VLAGRNTYEEHAGGMWGILNKPASKIMPTTQRWRQQTRCQAVHLVGLGGKGQKERGGNDTGRETRTKAIDWGLCVGRDDAATRLGADSAMERGHWAQSTFEIFYKKSNEGEAVVRKC
jgi:hypothetical protein